MIDHDARILYVDNSTLGAFKACKEKGNLAYNLGYRANRIPPGLGFGHAIHAGLAAMYDAMAGGYHDTDGKWYTFNQWSVEAILPLRYAKIAFLKDLGHTGVNLPVNLESEERRSIERGLALLEAYAHRYRNEPYQNIIINGRPLVEVGFIYDLCDWTSPTGILYMIKYCGYIDRIMLNAAIQKPVIFEFKTTTQALPQYVKHRKPNHQITGYKTAADNICRQAGLDEIRDTVWDCMFISDRQPNMKKSINDRFWMYGIDITKDFARETTQRSTEDVTEWWLDTTADARDYANWLFSGETRWPRTTGACNNFGGCDFRKVCTTRRADVAMILNTDFKIEKWNPALRIREERR